MINTDSRVFNLALLVVAISLCFFALGVYVWMEKTLVPAEKLAAFEQGSCEQRSIQGLLNNSTPINYMRFDIIKSTCEGIRDSEVTDAKNAKLAKKQLEEFTAAKP